jgi:hypothetical protein
MMGGWRQKDFWGNERKRDNSKPVTNKAGQEVPYAAQSAKEVDDVRNHQARRDAAQNGRGTPVESKSGGLPTLFVSGHGTDQGDR